MPTYSSTLGRFTKRESVSLKASAAETASTSGTGVEIDAGSLSLLLDVTAASGTSPTLDITIEGSPDNSTWFTLGTFTQKTAVSSERKAFPGAAFVRSRSVVAGTTPSFTYSVTGTVR